MSNETKQETIAELKARIAELEKEAEVKDTTIDQYKVRSEGWLVTCKNAAYQGDTADIKFQDGWAFVRKDQVYPRFVQVRSPEVVMAQFSQTERDAIEEALKIPSSKRCVDFLVNDFGYHAEFFNKDQGEELQKAINACQREAAAVREKRKEETGLMDRIMGTHQL